MVLIFSPRNAFEIQSYESLKINTRFSICHSSNIFWSCFSKNSIMFFSDFLKQKTIKLAVLYDKMFYFDIFSCSQKILFLNIRNFLNQVLLFSFYYYRTININIIQKWIYYCYFFALFCSCCVWFFSIILIAIEICDFLKNDLLTWNKFW